MKKIRLILFLLLSGCVSIPDGITPVTPFVADKYLGKWYEIARLDNSFERGLSQITADYSLSTDGEIKVINRGYAIAEKQWQQAEGKAYFVDKPDVGYLKVSFFGPFYSAYIVVLLDENYQYALVTSSSKSYLWILARQPKLDAAVQDKLIKKAAELGFETDKLIYVSHKPEV